MLCALDVNFVFVEETVKSVYHIGIAGRLAVE